MGCREELQRKPEEVYWVVGASCDSSEHEGGFRVASDNSDAGECDGGVFCGVFRRGGDRSEDGVVTHTPKAGDGNADASHNSFSPLSGLGSGEDLCFGERVDFMVDSGEKGGDWSNPDAELVLPSQVGGFELLQDGLEHLLSQWKHREVDPSGFFHGEDENDFLECSPLSKWDPNGHKELEVIQEGDEGEFRGIVEVNSKWVCSLMKFFL